MRSMTGYGRASAGIGDRTVTVQVSSVNRKTLDLTIKLPDAWAALEAMVTERVRGTVTRGRVQVDFELSGCAERDAPAWNETAIEVVLERLAALAERRGVRFTPTPELLWSIASSQHGIDDPPPVEMVRDPVISVLDEALAGLASMRAREGTALLTDLLGRLGKLEMHADAIADRAPGVSSSYRDQLLTRLRQAGLELELNDERVLREIALFADRCDISEELTRFRSHLDQLTSLLKSDAEIGRKAEFILQEMGREVNTMGSKANDMVISRAVIELKNELERIREQIANVE